MPRYVRVVYSARSRRRTKICWHKDEDDVYLDAIRRWAEERLIQFVIWCLLSSHQVYYTIMSITLFCCCSNLTFWGSLLWECVDIVLTGIFWVTARIHGICDYVDATRSIDDRWATRDNPKATATCVAFRCWLLALSVCESSMYPWYGFYIII